MAEAAMAAGGVAQGAFNIAGARKQEKAGNAMLDRILSLAAPTADELDALRTNLALQKSGIERENRILAAIDPSAIESANQAFELLQGKDAKVLEPVKRAREIQRKKLRDSLIERLGPDAETSTAGMQALGRFDEQTAQTLASAQQSALTQMLQTTANNRQMALGAQGTFGQIGSATARGFRDISNTQVQAFGMMAKDVLANTGNTQRAVGSAIGGMMSMGKPAMGGGLG